MDNLVMNALSQKPPTLVLTEAAARKVKSLIGEENNPHLNLRVFITGGGCSGFQYGFTFDEAINSDDFVIEKQLEEDGDEGSTGQIVLVKLLVDPLSLQYLQGAEIDYREDVSSAQFVIRNPNAKTTCGCGSSFAA
ncbi:iron-sulfur cluster insertion protein ErpA [Coxiella endosymbiont of Ornithodoros amblus]|uniref:iron-sulfur cluster insertion protein ErpA n=1 Tax=Coxiella endosymbiont of Ornithodoros amblus TaxID=1656166 RepID=UPI00244DFF0D|nr:iron-sulfur cluster insertion protein ErpA [Coxiella endosymbiont of Ornithodoros amblus]MBW5802884.1 iron-sulfur cluster insertion protein ErpA [Coxiella endosymbiont of Ornithodoros amblus]